MKPSFYIDFTVPVIDNYGDIGFALHLACLFVQNNPKRVIRFWSNSRGLFDKMLGGESYKYKKYITYYDIKEFTNVVKSPIRCNFFGYKIQETDLIGCKICFNFDYLQFPVEHKNGSHYSLHGTEYEIHGTLIRHIVPSPLHGFGGTLERISSAESTGLEGPVGIFVYETTYATLEPILKKCDSLHFYVFGVLKDDKQLFNNESDNGSFNSSSLPPQSPQTIGNITYFPFLDIITFEKILLSCKRCIVRGENTPMIALRGKIPFLWDIYKEDNGAHVGKMQDFAKYLETTISKKESTAQERKLHGIESYGKEVLLKYKAILESGGVNYDLDGLLQYLRGDFDGIAKYYPEVDNLFEGVNSFIQNFLEKHPEIQ